MLVIFSNIVIVIKCVDGFISQMFLECRFFSLRIVWMYHVFCSWQEVHLEKKSCEFPEPAKQTCNWRRRCSIVGSSVKPFWFSGSCMNVSRWYAARCLIWTSSGANWKWNDYDFHCSLQRISIYFFSHQGEHICNYIFMSWNDV